MRLLSWPLVAKASSTHGVFVLCTIVEEGTGRESCFRLVVIVAKSKPVLDASDIIHARAIWLMLGTGQATSLDIEASGMVYRVGFI